MLRSNLSTRPFYNERAVQLCLLLVALLVALLTVYNATRIIALSRHNTELTVLINRDRAEGERLTAEAQRIRAGIDQERLKAIAEAAGAANSLIDQRTFSWTELFNHIEETLPPDVMLTSVQPSFSRNIATIQMAILGRSTEDIEEFMDRLEATGAFANVLLVQEDRTDEGLHRGVVRSVYAAVSRDDAAGADPAQSGAGGPQAPAGTLSPAPGKAAGPAGGRPGRGGAGA